MLLYSIFEKLSCIAHSFLESIIDRISLFNKNRLGMKQKRIHLTLWLAVSVSLLSPSFLIASDEDTTEEPPQDNTAALQAMGFLMASQIRLNIGFSDDELADIFEGMRLAAANGDRPENFESSIQQAQKIYMERAQAFQDKEMERINAIAQANKEASAAYFSSIEASGAVQKSTSGLLYEIIDPGNGNAPKVTDDVIVNYRGTLIDGREFDANENMKFAVSGVIPGFTEGLQLIGDGGKIKLCIPSDLAYGDRPSRPGSIIEPGSGLIFEIDLLEVQHPTPPENARGPQGHPGPPPNFTPPPPPKGPPPPPPSGPPPSRPASLSK